jgi:hypothetical protein
MADVYRRTHSDKPIWGLKAKTRELAGGANIPFTQLLIAEELRYRAQGRLAGYQLCTALAVRVLILTAVVLGAPDLSGFGVDRPMQVVIQSVPTSQAPAP